MTVIYRQGTGRVSVADAKRWIAEALPPEPAVNLYEAPDGTIEPRWVEDAGFSNARIDATFTGACATREITPRHRHEPTRTDYTGPGLADAIYTITHDEFLHLAGLYGFVVEVGVPPSAEPVPPAPELAQAVAEPVPSADEAPPLEDWKMRVQAEAAAYWLRLRKTGANPTKASIRPHLLKWCQENNVLTKIGITPSDGYLKTHVLGKWEPPR
jgi:hypothetical protein